VLKLFFFDRELYKIGSGAPQTLIVIGNDRDGLSGKFCNSKAGMAKRFWSIFWFELFVDK